MSSKNKTTRQEKVKSILEVKFRSKKNIAKAKADLYKNLAILNSEMKSSKQAEITLRKELKKEEKELVLKLKRTKLEGKKNILAQKKLIRENRELLQSELRYLKKSIKNQKQENKNKEVKIIDSFNKDKSNLRKEYIIAKSNIKTDIIKLKSDYDKRKLQLKKDIIKTNEENSKQRIENIKLINQRKNDIKKYKLELKAEREKAIENAKRVKNEKFLTSERIKKDLIKERLNQEKLAQEEIANIKLRKQQEIHQIKMGAINANINIVNEENLHTDQINEQQRVIVEKEIEIQKIKKQFKNKIIANKQETEKLLEIDIEATPSIEQFQAIRGEVAKRVSKNELRLYDKLNSDISRVTISKLSLPKETKDRIKNFKNLKSRDAVVDIRDFRDYVNFITKEDKSQEDLEAELVSPIVKMFKGKVFSFLNTYLWVQRKQGNKMINSSQSLVKPKHSLVSLKDTKWNNEYEKIIREKINKGSIVKLNENIALMKKDKGIVAITDTPIMR